MNAFIKQCLYHTEMYIKAIDTWSIREIAATSESSKTKLWARQEKLRQDKSAGP